MVLRVHGRDAVTPVAVTSRSCTRGLDNGTGQISLSPQLHALLVRPLIINHLPPQNPGTR